VGHLLQILGIIAATVALVLVLRWRRQNQQRFIREAADREICPHLLPALQCLQSRGLAIARAGQRHPDLPFEIHMDGRFDPAELFAELQLSEPARVSERRVLYCHEDWVEIHPLT
jgi:hypothetical protein